VVPEDSNKRPASLSRTGSCSPSLAASPSYDGGRDGGRKKRKKPLAVAVGFNYANDVNGRPIVITPGGRRSPAHGGRSPGDRPGSKQRSPTRSGRTSSRGRSTPPRMPALSTVDDANRTPIALKYKSQVEKVLLRDCY
jgi:hypothetical protein